MKLKIWIKKQEEGKREVEISIYEKEKEKSIFMLTEAANEGEPHAVKWYYASGVIDGALASLGFSVQEENWAIKDMIRLHPDKSVMMVWENGRSQTKIVP